jgi:nephrocystin-3
MTSPSRLVRVFISSTFRDFIQERDELVKKVFPELRGRCKERFVELLEVDLRWGITEEQAKGGETLRICLEEIDRCRPDKDRGTEDSPVFFLGLLGERYGWIPDHDYFKPDVLEDPHLGWVKEHLHERKSVTELEILHGVLRNKRMLDRAFFYLRNDGYEIRHWEEIEKHHAGLKPAIVKEDFTNARSKTSEEDDRKQKDLKQRIRDASLKWYPRAYNRPRDMADMVTEDLWRAINQVFPPSSVPDALERESMEHRVFMQSRTRAYVGLPGLFGQLDAFVDSAEAEVEESLPATEKVGSENAASDVTGEQDLRNNAESAKAPPAVRIVLGESGSGKSALLAAWIAHRSETNGAEPLFFHFAGATAASVSASSLLHRLLATLRKNVAALATETVPSTDQSKAEVLPRWLAALSEQGGGVFVFDAVNQLASARDRELWWWPREWPDNICVIFSTLPGDSFREMECRGWTSEEFIVRVPLLQPLEKREVMNSYLKLFARKIEEKLQEKVLASPQSANPLFLRTVLDELRLRSKHEDLDADLDAMLACPDVAALFVLVLKNLERDFTPPEHPELVHRALGLMGMAARGLSESEILQLLSPSSHPGNDPLPRHYWAPLYLALEESLVNREGQLSFFHDYLRQAVLREYLDEEHERSEARTKLAEPALRWKEQDAFGASLRSYAFANGIAHLLDDKRTDKSLELLSDQEYRETAARALHQARPVLKDLQRLRETLAKAPAFDATQAAELTFLALRGKQELQTHLRISLDEVSKLGDWEDAMAFAAAEESETLRLLLACRALAGISAMPSEGSAAEVRALASKWADATGTPEWRELVVLLLPPFPPRC